MVVKNKKSIKAIVISGLVIASMGLSTAAFAASENAANANSGKWQLSVVGTSTNEEDNGCVGSIEDGEVRVYSLNGKGKIVAKSTDGIAYYYTAVPAGTNFTLTATGHVNDWFFSNGQEGFGVMAADRIGSGNSAFWNNSFAAAVTGYSYVADSGNKINMKIGVSSIERYGINNDNLYYFDQQDPDVIASYFYTRQMPLEKYCAAMDAGNYNIVGNSVEATHPFDADKIGADEYSPLKLDTTVKEITDFTLTVQKNNSGYFMSYKDEDGKTITQKSFVLGDDPLLQLDSENVYVGLFAARNMDVTFSDIELTTIDPKDDAPAETPENTYIDLDAGFMNAEYANQADNDLYYFSNWDGKLKVEDSEGKILFDGDAKSDEYVVMPVKLTEGENKFTAYFTPDEDFHYGYDENHKINLYNVLESYEEVKQELVIEYASYADLGDIIYTSPKASADGKGTKDAPFDLATAAKFVQPGQTILLADGRYELPEGLRLARGINGAEGKPVTLKAEDGKRPVIDLMKTGKALVIGGNYWNLEGFDVTGSLDGRDGMELTGSYINAVNIHAYRNGNTGIQVSRYTGHDSKKSGMWPHDVLVKNCISYDNSDSGFEDADGFAAKLTVGDNIVFDGCVAHHNADDGWDLFAKSELGEIGAVTIKNCVAYMNGYIRAEGREDTVAAKLRGNFTQKDGFVADEAGSLVNAGNGNGFKLGGSGLKGGHVLENSYAFMNKSNGITSNSCPDVKVRDSIAFDNGRSNLSLYTGDKVENTEFEAVNIITYRKYLVDGNEENIVCKGNQDNSVVFSPDNYIYSIENSVCENSEGNALSDDSFMSLTFDPEKDEVEITEDGQVDMGDFLRLSDASGIKTVSDDAAEEGADSVSDDAAPADSGDEPNFFVKIWQAICDFFANLFK